MSTATDDKPSWANGFSTTMTENLHDSNHFQDNDLSSTPKMQLVDLPTELLLNIASHAEQRDIYALVRTSRSLYERVKYELYRSNALHGNSSALLWAAIHGLEDTARNSRVAGAPENPVGRQALVTALVGGHDKVVRQLVWIRGKEDINANVPVGSPNDREFRETKATPLVWAAALGQERVVNILLATRGVDPNVADKSGRTPLLWAAAKGHVGIVRAILGADKVDVNTQNPDTTLPIDWEVKLPARYNKLIASEKLPNKPGMTPLCLAAAGGHESVVELLLKHKLVDADAPDGAGRTALFYAISSRQEGLVNMLLASDKFDLNHQDLSGLTPIGYAAQLGLATITKTLLAKPGVYPDPLDKCGRTPLSRAAQEGFADVVRVLLRNEKVSPNNTDYLTGRSPLTFAAMCGHKAVIEALLTHDAVDVDHQDLFGRTPLSHVAQLGRMDLVELLCEVGGADPAPVQDQIGYCTRGREPGKPAADPSRKKMIILSPATPEPRTKSKSNPAPASKLRESTPWSVRRLLTKAGISTRKMSKAEKDKWEKSDKESESKEKVKGKN